MVTTTTRSEVASAGVVRFGIVERLDGYGGHAIFISEAFGVAAGFAANEEWNLAQFSLGIGRPDEGDVRNEGRRSGRFGEPNRRIIRRRAMSRAQMRRHSAVHELEIVLEHRQQMF